MRKRRLYKGDVIKTNPREGFWGCAIVISERDKTEDRDHLCHIATTPLIFRQDYKLDELEIPDLTILEFDRIYNLKPNEEFTKKEILIGVYSRKIDETVKVIGNIDVSHIYAGPLPFEPWSDLEITYPLCGKVNATLGSEAVVMWRRLYDKDALSKEILRADKEHNEIMARIRQEESSRSSRDT